MQEELYDYSYNKKYQEMKEYYEGIYKKCEQLETKLVFFQGIWFGLMLIFAEYTRYRAYSGKLADPKFYPFVSNATLIALFIVIYRLIKCLVIEFLHLKSKYSAEEYFQYNCLAGKNIKRVWVVNDSDVSILYWMNGLKYARLPRYSVKGGRGKVSVIDTRKKTLEV